MRSVEWKILSKFSFLRAAEAARVANQDIIVASDYAGALRILHGRSWVRHWQEIW